MAKRRIFTVGFDLPGEEFEYIDFDSDQTLLDADIILFQPTLDLGEFDIAYGEQFRGKSVLNHHASLNTKNRLDHWRSEIVAAVNAGRLVIVYLTKPDEYFRYTGQQHYSGTGRSRVTENAVTEISSYEAIPKVKKAIPKSGTEIRLEKDGSYLGPYWTEFSADSPYQVEIEGDFNRIVLRARAGNRIVGAAFHANTGVLLFLPPIKYDEAVFLRDAAKGEDEDKKYWTKKALQFGKRLGSALVSLADALRQSSKITAPPNWTLNSHYRLDLESQLQANISTCSAKIADLQAEKAKLDQQLQDAGNLRRLLFEQGKPLEGAILEAMKLFGFDAQPFSNDESEFDAVFESLEGRCLGEAEGKDNSAINIGKFSQLERNLQEDFAREEVWPAPGSVDTRLS